MKLIIDEFSHGDLMPDWCANARLSPEGEVVQSENEHPTLRWTDSPQKTASFVIVCVDDDVPSVFDERDGANEIAASQVRRRFVHWVQADIAPHIHSIARARLSQDKKGDPLLGVWGINDYSAYASEKPIRAGQTGSGYDGPRPPSVDARWHYYHFIVLALDVPSLGLEEGFDFNALDQAMKGHILASAEVAGRYSLNPRLRRE